jgi:TolB-like protein
VLPFKNLSKDPEQEYFVDGMTDELITDLAKIGQVRVISHTSVMPYKAVGKSLGAIAGELNVDAIVEGTVLRSGNRVRVTAQLLGASPERHLWADSYQGDLADVLSLQDRVARSTRRSRRLTWRAWSLRTWKLTTLTCADGTTLRKSIPKASKRR